MGVLNRALLKIVGFLLVPVKDPETLDSQCTNSSDCILTALPKKGPPLASGLVWGQAILARYCALS